MPNIGDELGYDDIVAQYRNKPEPEKFWKCQDFPPLLTRKMLADILHCSTHTVYLHDRLGLIPGRVVFGKKVLFIKDDVEAWLKAGGTPRSRYEVCKQLYGEEKALRWSFRKHRTERPPKPIKRSEDGRFLPDNE